MIKLPCVSVSDFLNRKYLEWQLQEGGQRRTLDSFAEYIGVKRPLLSLWMNGKRQPGPEYKDRLIELFGDEAVVAFGEDPRLYRINKNWSSASEQQKDAIHEQLTGYVNKNDVRRTQGQRKKKRA